MSIHDETASDDTRPALVGLNHIALQVGDIEQALAFYRKIFSFELRGGDFDAPGGPTRAFIDMGDQFLALMKGRTQQPDEQRHFGLVVDDRSHVAKLAEAAGATMLDGPFLDFLDPWGNRVEVVEYRDLQFSKTPGVLEAMGLDHDKSEEARKELAEKGMLS